MEILSIMMLICLYLWLELHPFETPPQNTETYDSQLN